MKVFLGSLVFLMQVVLLTGCGQDGPDNSLLIDAVNEQLDSRTRYDIYDVVSVSVDVSENMGDKVEPVFKQRVKLKLKTSSPLVMRWSTLGTRTVYKKLYNEGRPFTGTAVVTSSLKGDSWNLSVKELTLNTGELAFGGFALIQGKFLATLKNALVEGTDEYQAYKEKYELFEASAREKFSGGVKYTGRLCYGKDCTDTAALEFHEIDLKDGSVKGYLHISEVGAVNEFSGTVDADYNISLKENRVIKKGQGKWRPGSKYTLQLTKDNRITGRLMKRDFSGSNRGTVSLKKDVTVNSDKSI